MPPAFQRLLRRFVEGDDAFRNSRFKQICKIEEGPFFVRKTVPARPAILGKTIKMSYCSGPGYFEVDVDTTYSAAAARIFGVAKSNVRRSFAPTRQPCHHIARPPHQVGFCPKHRFALW